MISSPGLILSANGTISTNPFISGLTANATGWQLRADGRAEFENAVIRGTLGTTVFEKDTVSAVGGQLMVSNATTLSASVSASENTMSIVNASGFVEGKIILAKANSQT